MDSFLINSFYKLIYFVYLYLLFNLFLSTKFYKMMLKKLNMARLTATADEAIFLKFALMQIASIRLKKTAFKSK